MDNNNEPQSVSVQGGGAKTRIWQKLQKGFAEIGISGRTVDSLALVPMVETAAGEGVITLDERERVFSLARTVRLLNAGVDQGLNEIRRHYYRQADFMRIWAIYLRDLYRQRPHAEKVQFRVLVTELCTFMCQTFGGFLKVPDLENRMMAVIENACA